jgi:phage/plasmid-associated DNA primase
MHSERSDEVTKTKSAQPKIFKEPVPQDEISVYLGTDYTPSESEKQSFTILKNLACDQVLLDKKLSAYDATTQSHALRFRERTKLHFTFNRDSNMWYFFNGVYCEEARRSILFGAIKLVSEGLTRESALVAAACEHALKDLCKDAGLEYDNLKKSSLVDRCDEIRAKLVVMFGGAAALSARVQEMKNKLDSIRSQAKHAASLAHDASTIKTGDHPFNLLKHVAGIPGIEHTLEEYDSDGLLKVCKNGTLDLRFCDPTNHPDLFAQFEKDRSVILRPSLPTDLNTMCMDTVYDPAAKAPLFEEQLEWVGCQPNVPEEEHKEIIEYFKKIFGGALDSTRVKGTFLTISGVAGSGKSVLVNTVGKVLGTYTAHVEGTFFLDNPHRLKGDAAPHLVKVVNKAIVIATEVKNAATQYLDEQFIKSWTGYDEISYRPMYDKKERNFRPTGQLVMTTNEKPKLSGDKAVNDRYRLAVHHCERTTSEAKRKDEDRLYSALMAQSAGVLNILLDGLIARNRIEGRIPQPPTILQDTIKYTNDHDEVESFFNETGVKVGVFPAAQCAGVTELFTKYMEYKNNAPDALSSKLFSAKLEGRGFRKDRSTKGMVWTRIALPAKENKNKRTQDTPCKVLDTQEKQRSLHVVTAADIDKELSEVEGL